MRWRCQGNRLHRRPGYYRPHPGAPAQEGTGNTYPATLSTTIQGTTGHTASFRWKGVQLNSIQSARKPLKNAWPGLLHAAAQVWTNMNCMLTDAGTTSRRYTNLSRKLEPHQPSPRTEAAHNMPFIRPIHKKASIFWLTSWSLVPNQKDSALLS